MGLKEDINALEEKIIAHIDSLGLEEAGKVCGASHQLMYAFKRNKGRNSAKMMMKYADKFGIEY